MHKSYPGGKRYLWNGEPITWKMIKDIYHDNAAEDPSKLVDLHRITYKHVYPTNMDKMKVNLALDIFSHGMVRVTKEKNFNAMSELLLNMNKFFNISDSTLNHRNPEKSPFYNVSDERLNWLEYKFIPYLENWKKKVNDRKKSNGEAFSNSEKEKMLLSPETMNGLIFTSKSFIGLTKYMLNIGTKFVILKRVSQDVLEAFFGQVRSKGAHNTNPTLKEFSERSHSINVVKKIKKNNITNHEFKMN